MASEPADGEAGLALRVVMMPRDTNPQGTIFGGILLSYIDQAGAVAAREYRPHRFVTVALGMNGDNGCLPHKRPSSGQSGLEVQAHLI